MLPGIDNPDDIAESMIIISSVWASYCVAVARTRRKNILPASDETYEATR